MTARATNADASHRIEIDLKVLATEQPMTYGDHHYYVDRNEALRCGDEKPLNDPAWLLDHFIRPHQHVPLGSRRKAWEHAQNREAAAKVAALRSNQ